MNPISFYTHSNFGDTMEHLNYLHRLCLKYSDVKFVQYTKEYQVDQLAGIVAGVPNISVQHIQHQSPDAICSWPGHEGFVWRDPNRNNDRVTFLRSWFNHLSGKIGLENPIQTTEDLLFKFPSLQKQLSEELLGQGFEVIVVNSFPRSGQFASFSQARIDDFARRVSCARKTITTQKIDGVPSTTDYQLTLAEIGSLSRTCATVTGIATGPIWPTINIWNHGRVNYVYIVDHEYINYGSNYRKAHNEDHAMQILRELGFSL